eukprot:5852125-Pleurochrysis_carterae.AAC.2
MGKSSRQCGFRKWCTFTAAALNHPRASPRRRLSLGLRFRLGSFIGAPKVILGEKKIELSATASNTSKISFPQRLALLFILNSTILSAAPHHCSTPCAPSNAASCSFDNKWRFRTYTPSELDRGNFYCSYDQGFTYLRFFTEGCGSPKSYNLLILRTKAKER